MVTLVVKYVFPIETDHSKYRFVKEPTSNINYKRYKLLYNSFTLPPTSPPVYLLGCTIRDSASENRACGHKLSSVT